MTTFTFLQDSYQSRKKLYIFFVKTFKLNLYKLINLCYAFICNLYRFIYFFSAIVLYFHITVKESLKKGAQNALLYFLSCISLTLVKLSIVHELTRKIIHDFEVLGVCVIFLSF